MASNYTEHYQLPLWEPEDSFLREEFNETHEKIDGALAALDQKLYIGTYDCTGTYGADNPVTLTFPFRPRVVYLAMTNRAEFPGCWLKYGTSRVYIRYGMGSSSEGFINLTWSGNSLSFYSAENATVQFNYSGTAIYIAVK